MSKSARERERLYQVYNRNLQLILEALKYNFCNVIDGKPIKTTDGYICPLCLNIFSVHELDQNCPNPLTLEHIEPNAVGGRKVVLTCKECNNTTGKLIDNALKIHTNHKADNIAQARFTLEDITLKGKFSFDPEQNRINSILNRNNDYVKRKIEKFFSKSGEKEIKFHISLENKHKFKCALLKIAHLKMFSVFGFGYLMNKSIYVIANQIRNSQEKLIDSIGIMELTESLPDEENIFYGEMDGKRFFLVKINLKGKKKNLRYGVFIPGPKESDLSLFQKINSFNGNKFEITPIESTRINYLNNPYSYYNFFR